MNSSSTSVVESQPPLQASPDLDLALTEPVEVSNGISGAAKRRRSVTFKLEPEFADIPQRKKKKIPKDIKQATLRKEFSIVGCVAVIVGTVVGAGIFGRPNRVLRKVDSIPVVLILWLSGGLVTSIGALVYAEIAVAFPVCGADYTYINRFYGQAFGSLYLLVSMCFMYPMNLAVIATVAGEYVMSAIPSPAMPSASSMLDFERASTSLGVFAMIVATYVCCTSTRLVSKVATVHLACKVGTAAFLVIVSLVYLGHRGFKPANATEWTELEVIPEISSVQNVSYYCLKGASKSRLKKGLTRQFFSVTESFYAVYTSYSGFEAPAYIIEELQDPEMYLPTGMFSSMCLITVVYVVLNLIYLSVLNKREFECAQSVASEVFSACVSISIPFLIPSLVAFSSFGTLIIRMHCLSRVLLAGARNGHLPSFFSLIHYKRQTPIPSLIFLGLLAVFYMAVGAVRKEMLLAADDYLFLLSFGLVLVGNIYERFIYPDIPRPFKVPLALQFISCTVVVAFLAAPIIAGDWTFKKPFVCGWRPNLLYLSGLLGFVFMVPIYCFFVRRKWTGNCVERALVVAENRVAIFLQKAFLLVEEENTRL